MYGDVVDVVVIKEVGPLIQLSKEAAQMEREMLEAAASDTAKGNSNAREYPGSQWIPYLVSTVLSFYFV